MDQRQEEKLQELLRKHRANLLVDSVRARVEASGPKSLPIPEVHVEGNEDRSDLDTSTPPQMIEILKKLAEDIPMPRASAASRPPTPFICSICSKSKQIPDQFLGFSCPCEVCISCISTNIYANLKPECPLCTQMYRHHEVISFLNYITRPPR